MKRANPDPDLSTIGEFAAEFGVDTSNVRTWIRKGYIRCEIGSNRVRFIRKSTVAMTIQPRRARNERTGPVEPVLEGTENSGAGGNPNGA